MDALWPTNHRLAAAARWSLPRRASTSVCAAELGVLVVLGVVAALATSAPMGGLRLPGHAILRGTLPLILGISLVPRRAAGSVMSLAAAGTFGALRMGGMGLPNPAAWVGLLCLGPAADLALEGASGGWWLYVRFAIAGLVANLAAFAVRMATAPIVAVAVRHVPGSGMGGGGGRGMGGGGGSGMGRALGPSVQEFWPTALISFALFGAAAGLLCAMIWFRARPRAEVAAP